MEKVSKSSLTPEQRREVERIEAAASKRIQNKRCRHLAPGTTVVYAGRQAQVLQHFAGGFMLVQYEDGSRQTLHPYGLR